MKDDYNVNQKYINEDLVPYVNILCVLKYIPVQGWLDSHSVVC